MQTIQNHITKTHILPSIYKHIGQGRSANNNCPKSLYFISIFHHHQSFIKTKDSKIYRKTEALRLCGEQVTATTCNGGICLTSCFGILCYICLADSFRLLTPPLTGSSKPLAVIKKIRHI